MRILLTGVTGFAGSLLVGRLRSQGHELRALARGRDRVTAPMEVVRADPLTGEGLERALDQIEVAYYLIHAMERSPRDPRPFDERDRIAAENFADAAARAGVRRIVYLGGLLPRPPGRGPQPTSERQPRSTSRHLTSREAVERILLAAVPDSVALRASIVIGARSRSFRLLVHLIERMPVLTLPAWRGFRTRPIDARDITEMLAAAATAKLPRRSLDVGGPDLLSYGEMIARIADLLLLRRPSVALAVSATPLAARFAAAIAGEDPELVLPLMESLEGDLLPADDHAERLLDVQLHSFDSAVEHALREWEEREPLAAR
jgi:uncharacterized protein YbjT (DUF2867 family)